MRQYFVYSVLLHVVLFVSIFVYANLKPQPTIIKINLLPPEVLQDIRELDNNKLDEVKPVSKTEKKDPEKKQETVKKKQEKPKEETKKIVKKSEDSKIKTKLDNKKPVPNKEQNNDSSKQVSKPNNPKTSVNSQPSNVQEQKQSTAVLPVAETGNFEPVEKDVQMFDPLKIESENILKAGEEPLPLTEENKPEKPTSGPVTIKKSINASFLEALNNYDNDLDSEIFDDEDLSEYDKNDLKNQLRNCLGFLNYNSQETQVIKIRFFMNEDKTIKDLRIIKNGNLLDQDQINELESRVIMIFSNTDCSSLVLPSSKFSSWKEFNVSLNLKGFFN